MVKNLAKALLIEYLKAGSFKLILFVFLCANYINFFSVYLESVKKIGMLIIINTQNFPSINNDAFLILVCFIIL